MVALFHDHFQVSVEVQIVLEIAVPQLDRALHLALRLDEPLSTQEALPPVRRTQKIRVSSNCMTGGAALAERQPSQKAGRAVWIHDKNMTGVPGAAEHLGRHPAAEIRLEEELCGDVIAHGLGRARLENLESWQGKSMRLHEMCRRVDMVHPRAVGDVGEEECVGYVESVEWTGIQAHHHQSDHQHRMNAHGLVYYYYYRVNNNDTD